MNLNCLLPTKALLRIVTFILSLLLTNTLAAGPQHYTYAVVMSEEAHKDLAWRNVADSLSSRHAANAAVKVFTWKSSVNDVHDSLAAFKPWYIGFIARPVIECNSSFIVAVSRLTRSLDNDPYGDAVWGIITGYEASDALRAVTEKLTIKTVLAASNNLSYEPPIQRYYQAIGMTCDSYTKTDYLFPGKSGKVFTENSRPGNEQDRIKLVAQWLNAESMNISVNSQGTINGPVDCMITGGHGNVNLWQCHYPEAEKEGFLQSKAGRLIGAPFSGTSIEIAPPTPKVYWCASNCLMGNPDNKDNVVYAAFHSGHAVQMFGFVNNASAGDEFMAWGIFDRVTKNAGTYTLPMAFFLSNNNALFEIENPTGEFPTQQVKLFMDSTVFYGDPAAEVVLYDVGDSARVYAVNLDYQSIGENNKATFSLSVTMRAHDLEFGKGYCYQFRPVSLLPVRIAPGTVVISKNEGHRALITDNLVIWEMLAKGDILPKGKTKVLTWTAEIADAKTSMLTPAVDNGTYRSQLFSANIIGHRPFPALELRNAPAGRAQLTLLDITGRVLCKKQWNSTGTPVQFISLSEELATGLTMLRLDIGTQRFMHRFVR